MAFDKWTPVKYCIPVYTSVHLERNIAPPQTVSFFSPGRTPNFWEVRSCPNIPHPLLYSYHITQPTKNCIELQWKQSYEYYCLRFFESSEFPYSVSIWMQNGLCTFEQTHTPRNSNLFIHTRTTSASSNININCLRQWREIT